MTADCTFHPDQTNPRLGGHPQKLLVVKIKVSEDLRWKEEWTTAETPAAAPAAEAHWLRFSELENNSRWADDPDVLASQQEVAGITLEEEPSPSPTADSPGANRSMRQMRKGQERKGKSPKGKYEDDYPAKGKGKDGKGKKKSVSSERSHFAQ